MKYKFDEAAKFALQFIATTLLLIFMLVIDLSGTAAIISIIMIVFDYIGQQYELIQTPYFSIFNAFLIATIIKVLDWLKARNNKNEN